MANILIKDPDGPIVNPQVIEQIFDEVQKMTENLVLDDDPLRYGPSYLQKKIAWVRNLQTKLQQKYLTISKADHQINRVLQALTTELEIEQADLMSLDSDVIAAPNVKDREALCNRKLRDKIEEKNRWDVASLETQAALVVIKSQQRDLKDLMSRLRDQKKLCEDEIALGKSWGSKAPPGSGAKPVLPGGRPVVEDSAESMINQVLDGVEKVREFQEVLVEEEVPGDEEIPNQPEEPNVTVDEITIDAQINTREEVAHALNSIDLDEIPDDVDVVVSTPAPTTNIPDSLWDF